MSKEPIAEIRLPNHHPAVSGTKAGQPVHIKAVRLPEPEPPKRLMGDEPEGPRPMPLEARFHVHDISHGGGDKDMDMENAEEQGQSRPTGKSPSPIDYVKARRATRK